MDIKVKVDEILDQCVAEEIKLSYKLHFKCLNGKISKDLEKKLKEAKKDIIMYIILAEEFTKSFVEKPSNVIPFPKRGS